MRLPRDVNGKDLISWLAKVGYKPTRTTGSHVRLTRKSKQGEHHITVPLHQNIRVGTLNRIFSDVATHLKLSKQELFKKLLE